jgi:hypothetical protein
VSEVTYPQLTQLPLVKRLRRRTVANRAADGRSVKLGDPAGEITEWELRYAELTDGEAATLREFFESVEGSLLPFTFVDPTANLLVESAGLDGSAWTRDPMLRVTGGPVEWRVSNDGGGPQSLWQDVGGPAGFVYCFSLFARADVATPVKLIAGSGSAERAVSTNWQRLRLTAAVEQTKFGVELEAGGSAEMRWLQVEAQAGASAARAGTTGGVFERAHFRDDTLEVVATGVNRHSCTVKIVHAIHI